ncbi:MAG: hypothetical protein B6242_14220 [Anaerolineaceae bacterium 4572_78]|nr:MAG: hypothetical protein B6242_14220 [Anaerolineaceae bacterium 4572_78]
MIPLSRTLSFQCSALERDEGMNDYKTCFLFNTAIIAPTLKMVNISFLNLKYYYLKSTRTI